MLVDEKATMQLAEQFTANTEFLAIVLLTSRVVAAKDEHRKDAPLKPTARLSGGTVFAGISETDESFVASAILKQLFQIADAT